MNFSFGQRIAIRILAWCLRRRPGSAPELRQALDQGYRHRPEELRIAMWQAALQRNGIRVG